MCTHSRLIYNKYIDQYVRVDCGKCDECQQKKADKRAQRIRDSISSGQLALFITLTYSNNYLPYIKKSDLYSFKNRLPIYRNYESRYIRTGKGKSYRTRLRHHKNPRIIDYVDVNYEEENPFKNLKTAKGLTDVYSIIYYKDLQDFVKRFKVNCKRMYNFDFNENDSLYFSCAEYGPTTYRAHFHLLIIVPSDFETRARTAIIKSWSYAYQYTTSAHIQIARDAAGYVSSYTNRPADFPKFFSQRTLKPRHSYSQNLGINQDCFSLSSILAKVAKGNLFINRTFNINGLPSVVAVPIPKYVINRYFPKCKGFTHVLHNQGSEYLQRFIECPTFQSRERTVEAFRYIDDTTSFKKFFSDYFIHTLSDFEEFTGHRLNHLERRQFRSESLAYLRRSGFKVDSRNDSHKWIVALQNAQKRSGMPPSLYAWWYLRTWDVYNNTVMRNWYNQMVDPLSIYESFEWNEDLSVDEVQDFAQKLSSFPAIPADFINDPNQYKQNVILSDFRKQKFHSLVKHRKVINYAMSETGHDV